jgi:hypothetical protein
LPHLKEDAVVVNVAEKRKFPRLTINADVTYTKSSSDSQYEGFCKNLSHTGILFVTGQKLSPGDSVVVTLDIKKSSNFQPLKAMIEIVRTEPSEDKYAVAGKIVEYQ